MIIKTRVIATKTYRVSDINGNVRYTGQDEYEAYRILHAQKRPAGLFLLADAENIGAGFRLIATNLGIDA